MSSHANFGAGVLLPGLSIASSWKGNQQSAAMETQTEDSLWSFSESETQCGVATLVKQYQVKAKSSGLTLLNYLSKADTKLGINWREPILNGNVTVDCEVITSPNFQVLEDFFIELVDYTRESSTQTTALRHHSDGSAEEKENQGEDVSQQQGVMRFLGRVLPMVEKELELNITSKAFEGISNGNIPEISE